MSADRSSVLAQIAVLVNAVRGHPEDHAEAGRRTLTILRDAGMSWHDILPLHERHGFRATCLLQHICGTLERLDLCTPFDLARLAILAAKPEAANSAWDPLGTRLPTEADQLEWAEIAGRVHRQIDEEHRSRMRSIGVAP